LEKLFQMFLLAVKDFAIEPFEYNLILLNSTVFSSSSIKDLKTGEGFSVNNIFSLLNT